MKRMLLLLLLPLALLAAACGDDDDSAIDAPSEAADGGGESGDGAAVTIAGFAYDPATIEVAAGTTVTWTNDDGAAHTVSSGAPGEVDGTFDESVGASGGTAQVTFDEPGTYPYFCTIHPSMTGEVVAS